MADQTHTVLRTDTPWPERHREARRAYSSALRRAGPRHLRAGGLVEPADLLAALATPGGLSPWQSLLPGKRVLTEEGTSRRMVQWGQSRPCYGSSRIQGQSHILSSRRHSRKDAEAQAAGPQPRFPIQQAQMGPRTSIPECSQDLLLLHVCPFHCFQASYFNHSLRFVLLTLSRVTSLASLMCLQDAVGARCPQLPAGVSPALSGRWPVFPDPAHPAACGSCGSPSPPGGWFPAGNRPSHNTDSLTPAPH